MFYFSFIIIIPLFEEMVYLSPKKRISKLEGK